MFLFSLNTYFGGIVTRDPLGREKKRASSPKMNTWYLIDFEVGFFKSTCSSHTEIHLFLMLKAKTNHTDKCC